MFYEKIDLYGYFGRSRNGATGGHITAYAPTIKEMRSKRPAMLILPGGGYSFLSEREGEPVALAFAGRGYASFVLEYTVGVAYPTPLIEACMAVCYIRESADKFDVDKDHVGAVGFSAGGNLAAMLATIYGEKEITDVLGERAELSRPDAVILSYPVATLGGETHGGTCDIITGGDEDLRKRISPEKRITRDSSPAFVWHTADDDCVPVENSLAYAAACAANGVPFALHIYEHGWHGLSLCGRSVNENLSDGIVTERVEDWFVSALAWLESHGFSATSERR